MTILECFEKYIGVREYDGIVATIQKWFYGYVSKTAWCATSMSYFAHLCGVLDQLGGKNEGVWEMYNKCKTAHKGGIFYDYGFFPETIPEGAVLFFLRNGASHVTLCHAARRYERTNVVSCLGGNQNDSICIKGYAMGNIQGIFIPDYNLGKKPVIKKGYKDSEKGGNWCAYLQKCLNQLIGTKLALDGSCGSQTDAAIRAFQSVNGLVVDGSCGGKTWAKIDEMMSEQKIYISEISAGDYTYTDTKDGYAYIPDLDIWAKLA